MTEDRAIGTGILIGVVVASILATLIICVVLRDYRNAEGAIVSTFARPIELSPRERQELQTALAAWAIGEKSHLTGWVESLQQRGKYGILPELPCGDLPDTVYIKRIERSVLLPQKAF